MMQTGTFSQQQFQNGTLPQQQQTQQFQSANQFRVEQLNWLNIHNLDLKQAKKNNEVETLETFLPNIMNSTIDEEEFNQLKPETLQKLMEIMQLSLQYFDYTCDYLDNLAYETQDEVCNIERKIKDDEKMLKKSKRDIDKQKQEISIKKQALSKYKNFMQKKPALKCHICTNKFFQNDEYLEAHMKRRHPQHLPLSADHPQFGAIQNMLLAQHLKQEHLDREIKSGVTKQNLQNQQQINSDQTSNQNQQLQTQLLQQQQLQQQQQQIEQVMKNMESNIQNYIQLNNQQQQQQNTMIQNNMEKKMEGIQNSNIQYYQKLLEQYNDMKVQNLELQKQNLQQQQQYNNQVQELKPPQYQYPQQIQTGFANNGGVVISPIHQPDKLEEKLVQNPYLEKQPLPKGQRPPSLQKIQPENQQQKQTQPNLDKIPTTYTQNKDSQLPQGKLTGIPSVYSEKVTGSGINMEDIMLNIPQNTLQPVDENKQQTINNNSNNIDNISEDIDRPNTEENHNYDEDGFSQSENDLETEKEKFSERTQQELKNKLEQDKRIAHLLVNPNPDSPTNQNQQENSKKTMQNTSRLFGSSVPGRNSLNEIKENEEYNPQQFQVPKGHEKFQSHEYLPQQHGNQHLKYNSQGSSNQQPESRRDNFAVSSELEDSELQFKAGGQFGQSSRFKGQQQSVGGGNKQEELFMSQNSSQPQKKQEWELEDSFEKDLEGYKAPSNNQFSNNQSNQRRNNDFDSSDNQSQNQQKQNLKNLYAGHESSSSYFD